MNYKKCISSVVSNSILIIVVVVAAITFQTWYNNYSSNIYSNVEQTNDSISVNQINDIVGNDLYFNGKDNSNIQDILVEGKSCNISLNVSGIKSIDISDCLENLATQTPEITVILNNGVINRKVYLPEIQNNFEEQSESVDLNPFISVWNTSESGTSSSNQIALPLESGRNYDFFVIGENLIGSPVHITNYSENILNFSNEGLQEINITGTIKGFSFNNGGDKLKLYEIKAWGVLNVGNSGNYFYGCSNFDFTGNDTLDLNGTYVLNSMFRYASSFNGNISNWDVSKITSLHRMFYYASSFNQPLNDWNTSKVTNMYGVFSAATSFNQPLNNWDVSSVTDMSYMFFVAYKFNRDLSSWNVSSVNSCAAFDASASAWSLDRPALNPSCLS